MLIGPLGLRFPMTQVSIDSPCDGLTVRVHGTKAALARISVPWNEFVRSGFHDIGV
jgi:hypothetical protein